MTEGRPAVLAIKSARTPLPDLLRGDSTATSPLSAQGQKERETVCGHRVTLKHISKRRDHSVQARKRIRDFSTKVRNIRGAKALQEKSIKIKRFKI